MSTYPERIKEAVEGSGVSIAAVANACGIKPQSIYQWLKGETEPTGENLVELAATTGYEARWIARGIGPKKRLYARTLQQALVLQAMEKMPERESDQMVKIGNTLAEPQSPAQKNTG